jgi:Zn finger protein HypA/HybF involved in hydrogenase expression
MFRCIECDGLMFSTESRERGTCPECHEPEQPIIPIDLEDQLENAMKNIP